MGARAAVVVPVALVQLVKEIMVATVVVTLLVAVAVLAPRAGLGRSKTTAHRQVALACYLLFLEHHFIMQAVAVAVVPLAGMDTLVPAVAWAAAAPAADCLVVDPVLALQTPAAAAVATVLKAANKGVVVLLSFVTPTHTRQQAQQEVQL